MDIGASFDDDFFEPTVKKKQENVPQNYEAKFCMPLWFLETNHETEDELLSLKHRADYYYYSKNYPKAVECYERCLRLVPSSNNTWKREFMENLARSFVHMDNPQKALEWSLMLDKSSFSPDQKIVSMNLLATVCHKLGKYEEELEALHCCLEVHKSCPEFWLRLGLCYAGLFKLDLPEQSAQRRAEEQEACCVFSAKRNLCSLPQLEESVPTGATLNCSAESAISINSASTPDKCSSATSQEVVPSKCDICTLGTQLVSSCFIHTKMLIDSGGPNLLDTERDEGIKRKVENSLKHMEVDQVFIDVASEMLGPNFLAQLQVCDNPLEKKSNLTTNQSARGQ